MEKYNTMRRCFALWFIVFSLQIMLAASWRGAERVIWRSRAKFSMSTVSPSTPPKILARGEVKAGYGRGSKKLGFPTANFPDFSAELMLPSNNVQRGVYYGFCLVEKDSDTENIRPCVTNIGLAPTFQDEKKASDSWIMETFIIGRPKGLPDFYGRKMKLLLLGFIRPEKKFESLEDLKAQITLDVKTTRELTAPILTKNKAAIDKAFQDFSNVQRSGTYIQFINKSV